MSAKRLALRYALLALVTHALFVTATLVPGWRVDPLVSGDATTYLQPAESLLRNGAFSRESSPPFRWEPYRTPGYPVAIAASIMLLGDYRYVLYAACATAAVAAFVCAWLAFQWGGPRAAHGAGVLASLLPNSLGLAGYMWTDAIAGHLTVVWLCLLYIGLSRRSRRALICAALMLMILQLVKPTFNAALLLIPVAAWAIAGRRQSVLTTAVLVGAGLLVPTYLGYRNYQSHGIASPTLLDVETARLYLQAAHVTQRTGQPYRTTVSQMTQDDRARAAQMTAARSDDGRLYLARREAVAGFFAQHPFAAARLMAVESVRQLAAPQHFPFVMFSQRRPVLVMATGSIITLLLFGFALTGGIALARTGKSAPVVLAVSCLVFFLATGSLSRFVGARLRFPADMSMVPLAGLGVAMATSRRRRREGNV